MQAADELTHLVHDEEAHEVVPGVQPARLGAVDEVHEQDGEVTEDVADGHEERGARELVLLDAVGHHHVVPPHTQQQVEGEQRHEGNVGVEGGGDPRPHDGHEVGRLEDVAAAVRQLVHPHRVDADGHQPDEDEHGDEFRDEDRADVTQRARRRHDAIHHHRHDDPRREVRDDPEDQLVHAAHPVGNLHHVADAHDEGQPVEAEREVEDQGVEEGVHEHVEADGVLPGELMAVQDGCYGQVADAARDDEGRGAVDLDHPVQAELGRLQPVPVKRHVGQRHARGVDRVHHSFFGVHCVHGVCWAVAAVVQRCR